MVLAVISKWVKDNNPKNIKDLQEKFPPNLNTSFRGLFVEKQEAENIKAGSKRNIPRHFLEENEILKLDSKEYAINNQWGLGNLKHFIDHAIKVLGYKIEEF